MATPTLTAEEYENEARRYYAGDRRARNPLHLLREVLHEELTLLLGPDNWAVVRYATFPVPQLPEKRPVSKRIKLESPPVSSAFASPSA